MTERKGVVTFKGGPMTLLGAAVKVGDRLPALTVTGQDLTDITAGDFAGKVLIISVVPSLDTPVCAVQTRTFNKTAATLSGDVAILTVSMDLPFAAKRFCAAEGITAVKTGSDYRYQSFGEAFGVKIKELGLLTRAVFVAGKDGRIRHAEYVAEMTAEPDYAAALQAVKAALA
jgi:thioredoxin-dependent peroxiredoxin